MRGIMMLMTRVFSEYWTEVGNNGWYLPSYRKFGDLWAWLGILLPFNLNNKSRTVNQMGKYWILLKRRVKCSLSGGSVCLLERRSSINQHLFRINPQPNGFSPTVRQNVSTTPVANTMSSHTPARPSPYAPPSAALPQILPSAISLDEVPLPGSMLGWHVVGSQTP
jgi:hypothetical protein